MTKILVTTICISCLQTYPAVAMDEHDLCVGCSELNTETEGSLLEMLQPATKVQAV